MTTREKLDTTRPGVTHAFRVGTEKGYLTVGEYADGRLGEIFIRMDKEGSTLSGFADALAMSLSIALQHGVPLRVFVDKFTGIRFEPQGPTGSEFRPIATSIIDYVAHWLEQRYLTNENQKTD